MTVVTEVYEQLLQVRAVPMTCIEYGNYRQSRGLPTYALGAPDDEGYLVEGPGQQNDPRHNGYIQWIAKESFEQRYHKINTPKAVNSENALEAEIQEKGLTAPRVTPTDLTAAITHTEIVKHITPSGQILRWAVLTLDNGFAVTGKPSAAASSENDNAEIGTKIAIDNARSEVWALLAFRLRDRMMQP